MTIEKQTEDKNTDPIIEEAEVLLIEIRDITDKLHTDGNNLKINMAKIEESVERNVAQLDEVFSQLDEVDAQAEEELDRIAINEATELGEGIEDDE